MKKIFSKMKIGNKLVSFFLMLVVVPLIIFTIVFNHVMTTTAMEQIEHSSSLFVNQALVNIDKELEEQDNTVLNFQWDSGITEILRKSSINTTLRERQNQAAAVIEKMQIYSNARLGIELLYLLRTDKEEYSISAGTEAEKMVEGFWNEQNNLSNHAKKTDGRINWLRLSKNDTIILGIRDVYDVERLNKTGLIVVGIREEQISKLYANLMTTPNSLFIIYDTDGNIISSNPEGSVDTGAIFKSVKEGADWAEIIGGYNIMAEKSDYTGWYVVQATPNSEIISNVNRTQIVLFGIIFIILAILLTILKIFTNTMISPIRQLMGEMEKIKKENFDIHADDSREDEFGELAVNFNHMVKKIKNLIEEDYRKKLVLQDAEYKYLRAQINPHFIYNTLDSINWMAMEAGQRNISKIAVALGRLLRRSISEKKGVIFLGDELESLKDYIVIQKMRYGSRLNADINIPEEYLCCAIPKSTLQPIVENALVHGIDFKPESGHIEISATEEEGVLILCIKDDGIGMSAEKISQVLDGNAEEESREHAGIGIKNVDKRIKLLFGEEYGIEIKSITGIGTDILIKVPGDCGDDKLGKNSGCGKTSQDKAVKVANEGTYI